METKTKLIHLPLHPFSQVQLNSFIPNSSASPSSTEGCGSCSQSITVSGCHYFHLMFFPALPWDPSHRLQYLRKYPPAPAWGFPWSAGCIATPPSLRGLQGVSSLVPGAPLTHPSSLTLVLLLLFLLLFFFFFLNPFCLFRLQKKTTVKDTSNI